MNRIKHLLKDLAILIRANLWLIPVIAALVAAVFYFVAPPPPMSATMATGAEGGGYAVFAGKLREKLKEQGFELKLVPSAGSRDNLERLLGTGEVDIALVQSGQERQLEAGQARQLQTLGAVYQEPLWLFHRSNVHIDQLSDLLHLRLAIGSDGSGTRAANEARLPFLKRVEVGEGLLNLPRNVPERNISTLSPVATLVINERFHPALIPLVLEAAREVMKDGSLLDKPGAFPSAEPRTLRLHEDAERYYKSGLPLLQRYLPFRIASLADRYIILLIPFIAILIPLMKSIGPLYRWRIRARIYRWYRYIRDIDRKLDSGTDAEQLRSEIERLEKLESELNTVEVPLSYYHELYELHLHLNFVIKRLHGLQERQATQAEAGNLG